MIPPFGMDGLARFATILLVGLCVGFGSGCGKKAAKAEAPSTSADTAVAKPPQNQSAESEVMAALEKKDYDGVMAALAKVKDAATTEDQVNQFKTLCRQASIKMQGAALSDPKAAEALAALRIMSTGR